MNRVAQLCRKSQSAATAVSGIESMMLGRLTRARLGSGDSESSGGLPRAARASARRVRMQLPQYQFSKSLIVSHCAGVPDIEKFSSH